MIIRLREFPSWKTCEALSFRCSCMYSYIHIYTHMISLKSPQLLKINTIYIYIYINDFDSWGHIVDKKHSNNCGGWMVFGVALTCEAVTFVLISLLNSIPYIYYIYYIKY